MSNLRTPTPTLESQAPSPPTTVALESEELEMELLDCGPAYVFNDVGVRCINCGCYCIAADDSGDIQ